MFVGAWIQSVWNSLRPKTNRTSDRWCHFSMNRQRNHIVISTHTRNTPKWLICAHGFSTSNTAHTVHCWLVVLIILNRFIVKPLPKRTKKENENENLTYVFIVNILDNPRENFWSSDSVTRHQNEMNIDCYGLNVEQPKRGSKITSVHIYHVHFNKKTTTTTNFCHKIH